MLDNKVHGEVSIGQMNAYMRSIRSKTIERYNYGRYFMYILYNTLQQIAFRVKLRCTLFSLNNFYTKYIFIYIFIIYQG